MPTFSQSSPRVTTPSDSGLYNNPLIPTNVNGEARSRLTYGLPPSVPVELRGMLGASNSVRSLKSLSQSGRSQAGAFGMDDGTNGRFSNSNHPVRLVPPV